MSIFSRFRRSRQQAKEKKEAAAKQQQQQAKPAPYRHTPRHAASDSISSGPSAHLADQARVREANHRRSGMTIVSPEVHMGYPRSPRVDSSASCSNSFVGSSLYSRPGFYSNAGSPSSRSVSIKGKEVDRGAYSPCLSPSPSKGGESPSGSSGTSLDGPEIQPAQTIRVVQPATASRPSTAIGHPHRLHPSARNPSDVSVDKIALAKVARLASTPLAHRDTRSQPSVPPVTHTPPKQLISKSGSPHRSQPHSHSRNPSGQSSFWERHSRQGSVSSLPALTPTSTNHHSSGPMTPQSKPAALDFSGFDLEATRSSLLDFDFQFDTAPTSSQVPDSGGKDTQRCESRSRYQEQEIIDPSVGLLDFGLSRKARDVTPSRLTPDRVVNTFPAPASPPTPTPKSKSWKLGKPGTKLLRRTH
ncbi:hypothetical protein QQZ08_006029 [Neonectria magnoliae]|uniref:Uncharacterized protein n=1 Tax=Neonectria magnoliae TaxID=2732573 RepID=A0ABR1I1M2_9HYPO